MLPFTLLPLMSSEKVALNIDQMFCITGTLIYDSMWKQNSDFDRMVTLILKAKICVMSCPERIDQEEKSRGMIREYFTSHS